MGKRGRFKNERSNTYNKRFQRRPMHHFRGRSRLRPDPFPTGRDKKSRKRHHYSSMEPDSKRQRLDPRNVQEDCHENGRIAQNMGSCIQSLYDIAKTSNQENFFNECHMRFKEVFDLGQKLSKRQFENILQMSRRADFERNKNMVSFIIDGLPHAGEVCPLDLANRQCYIRQALVSGHLITEEQFLRLLGFLSECARYYAPSLLCQILQDTNFFNNAGVLSNIVHLLRKYKDDGDHLLRFCKDIFRVLSTLANSRKSNKGMVLSCLHLLEDNIERLPNEEREGLKERRKTIIDTIYKNELSISDFEELQVIATYPILPSTDDIKEMGGPIIPPRNIGAAFGSEIQYLSYYFNTFVEDFIGPLRDGINRYVTYVNDRSQRQKFRDDDIRLYKRVKVSKEKFLAESGKVFEIEFDVSSFKKLRWDTCDFLKFGNLVCLTYNDCQDIVYGLVADRKVPDLRSGKTLIKIVSDEQIMAKMLTTNAQLVMIESKAFFTAYHHTLLELQNMAERMIHDRTECIPLAETICFLHKEALPPLYIKSACGISKQMDFSCMLSYGDSSENKCLRQPSNQSWSLGHTSPNPSCSHENSSLVTVGVMDGSTSPNSNLNSFNSCPVSPCNSITSPDYSPASPIYNPSSPDNTPSQCALLEHNSSLANTGDSILLFPHDRRKLWLFKRKVKREIPVLSFDQWPTCKMMGLDSSQYAAFQHAITSSLAIIQGPPGTGKTLLGLRIAEFLLHNHDSINGDGQKPILLLSYTNHALDQFMEEILQKNSIRSSFQRGKSPFLRIGGRCENEVVKSSMLFEHKRRRFMFEEKDLKRKLMQLAQSIDKSLETMERMQFDILHEECLMSLGIIPSHLHCALCPKIGRQETLLLQFLGIFDEHTFRFCGQNEYGYRSNEQGYTTQSMSDSSTSEFVDQELYHEIISKRIVWEDEESEECDAIDDKVGFAVLVNENCKDRNISRRKLDENIRRKLSQTIPFTADEEASLTNPWYLIHENRWQLYKLWVKRLESYIKKEIEDHKKLFLTKNEEFNELQRRNTLEVMRDCRLIAMTTTGAAKHMDLLRKVAPRIIIVEEAAQVNEQHILGCLHKDAQHLILIGDHQQLKPSVNNFSLAKQHKTDMSMMERLALNGVPFQRLNEQHRMIPVISHLLRSTIYEDLLDHASVLEYDPIRGMAQNVVLFDHKEDESQRNEHSTSYRNEFEAEMITGLYRYLRLQGYKSKDITILSAYNEQVRCIRNMINPVDKELIQREDGMGIELPGDIYRQNGNHYLHDESPEHKSKIQKMKSSAFEKRQSVRVTAVEKRQGVRVTAVDNFQGEENKIILLSLVRSNKEGRIGHLRDEKRICVSLSRAKLGLFVLGNFSLLQERSKCWAKLLEKARETNLINEQFPLVCQNHPGTVINIKQPGDFVSLVPEGGCKVPCEKQLKCGHICPKTCHSDTFVHDLPCWKECTKTCSNGHPCKKRCSEPCGKCNEMMEKIIPRCGHSNKMSCFKHPNTFLCKERCEKIISCPYNHRCQKPCGTECNSAYDCMELVKVKDKCGHEYQTACCNHRQLSCKVPCLEPLPCGHVCRGTCGSCSRGRLHVPCNQKCKRVLICGHTCNAPHPCTTNCPPCNERCTFSCSHRPNRGCQYLCGEICKPCVEKCYWRCNKGCRNKLRCTKYCHEMCDRERCNRPCNKIIPTCKDPCVGLCGEPCPKLCRICHKDELTDIFFGTEDEPDARFVQLVDCGHVFEVTGLDKYIDGLVSTEQSEATTEIVFISCPRCKTPIKRSFRYGNIIKSIKRDIEKVKKSMNDTDEKRYNIIECEQLLFSVVQCTIDKQLTKTLELFMNIEKTEKFNVSYTRSLKGLLNQLHKHVLKIYQDLIKENRSVVFESRPVLQQIIRLAEWISQKRIVFSQFELEQFPLELRRLRTLIMFHILQQDCQRNKTVFAEGLEKIDEAINELEYPKINSIEVLEKYENLHSELRKEIPRNGLGVSENEKIEILKAMDLKKGHWYKCKNGHVYCIGECGGAMEKSICPECGDVIGGERHTLTGGNSVATEMDGATYAAWSEEANNMDNFDMQDLP